MQGRRENAEQLDQSLSIFKNILPILVQIPFLYNWSKMLSVGPSVMVMLILNVR